MADMSPPDYPDEPREAHGKEGVNGSSPLEGFNPEAASWHLGRCREGGGGNRPGNALGALGLPAARRRAVLRSSYPRLLPASAAHQSRACSRDRSRFASRHFRCDSLSEWLFSCTQRR
jgi:hypothetical protein